MNNYSSRITSPPVGVSAGFSPRASRSAALLIDFDNVTLGVHSDLGRELKNLINSEVFRGKIAVRRAYADWRRFPNYVVPLTEASIDLIFAPAYGSSKKNTTDLRMSADAIELAFTRPEIDTFILLTGDSDFSSTVMKLKEYGKFVIGVGMRESSSDLIIQNCDEYYSYHALTGLTRANAGEGTREDPWELVVRAVQKMAASGDTMRTDRLKQVMLSLDQGFNEKEIGYSKFSRFVHEAEKKGLIKLQKLPDGQYVISIDGVAPAEAAAAQEPRERREPRDARRDRRGDRGRRREPAGDVAPRAEHAVSEEGVEATPAVVAEDLPSRAVETTAPVPRIEASAMEGALALLQRAIRALSPRGGAAVRDGDVKRRMLELEASFDESQLGYSKFSRFLRAAHDNEAIDLERFDDGHYELKVGSRRYRAEELAPEPTPASAGVVEAPPPTPAPPTVEVPSKRPPAASLRGRTRGRAGELAGPPPLLPGQVVQPSGPLEGGESTPARGTPEPALSRPETKPTEVSATTGAEPVAAMAAEVPPVDEAPRKRRRGGRGRKRPTATSIDTPADSPTDPAAGITVEAEPPAITAVPAEFSAEALGLPVERSAIENYLARSYKGVGKKTAEPLLEAFGADIFRVFADEPHRVVEVLGEKRAATVLEQWTADHERRLADAAPAAVGEAGPSSARAEVGVDAGPAADAVVSAATQEAAAPTRRRGGRGRSRKPVSSKEASDSAEAVASTAEGDEPAMRESTGQEAEAKAPRRARARGGRGRSSRTAKKEPVSP